MSAHSPSRKRPCAALVLSLALIGALLASLAPGAEAKAPRSFFGVIAAAPTEADYRKMGKGGLGASRVALAWGAIQAKRNGGFNWAGVDNQFRRAADNGLEPVPMLFGTPSFIKSKPGRIKPPTGSKRNRRAWQAFVRAAAARYGPGGHFWTQNPLLPKRAPREFIIWNEQNAPSFWRPKPDVGEYATLLRLAARGAGEGNPAVRTVVGGMHGNPKSKQGIRAARFVRKLYRQKNIRGAIDGIALHPYAGGVRGVRKQINQVRKAARKAGARPRLVIGELGWASGGNGDAALTKSRKGQARILRKSYRMLLNKRQAWRIDSVFWYVWKDQASNPNCRWCPKAGLVNQKGKDKPSWRAYKRLIARNAR
jgi:hypothetical protein